MKVALQGIDGIDALFSIDGKGVVVHTRTLRASLVPLDETAMSRFWVAPGDGDPVDVWSEVALSAVLAPDKGDVTVTSGAGTPSRGYTIPNAVRKTATEALQRTRFGARGAETAPSSLLAARSLAAGGQITLREISHLARFLASTNRSSTDLVYNLWGGKAAARWTRSVVKGDVLMAAGDAEINMLAFYEGDDDERAFFAQKVSDHEVTALFKRDADAGWQLWFNGDWEPSDPPAQGAGLVELDDDTAVFVAGSLYDSPGALVSLRDADPEAWDLAMDGLKGVDLTGLDRTLRAAGAEYDSKERSQNASAQLRDANGRFAKVGDTGTMKSGMGGKIVNTNPVDNSLIIEADDGNSYAIPASDFEVGGTPKSQPSGPSSLPPLDLDSILAQPRATETTPKAFLKSVLQPMGPAQLKQVITDYEEFIKSERLTREGDFEGGTGWEESKDPTPAEVRATRELERSANRHERNARRIYKSLAAEDGADVAPVEKLDPDTSDIKPLYLAIVDRDDPQAVTDLVALVPASDASNETTAFRRVGGSWVEDVKILQDMRSPTPPPVVQLDDTLYTDVLTQVDNAAPEPEAVTAAAMVSFEPEVIPMWGPNSQMVALIAAGEGGLDRNKGNAEALRRYWLFGPGAAKIRWGTGGDWKRCVRQLSKYLGVRSKGYCALRHHEITGMWPGDKRNSDAYGVYPGAKIFSSSEDLLSRREILVASAESARIDALRARVYNTDALPVEPEQIDPNGGRRFRIPLVIPEGIESGDGRTFDVGALSIRSFPLPLLWQVQTGDGHDGSYLVGRIDGIERIEGGLGNGYGVFDTGPWGAEAQRLVENKMLRWVSADLDRFKAEEEVSELSADGDEDEDTSIQATKLRIKSGRVMGATLVAKPAFQECTIELEPIGDIVTVSDGIYEGEPEESEMESVVASGTIAASIPVEPPETWFNRPVLNGPTPIMVTDQGQVYGHIATWDRDHIGMAGNTRAPRSRSSYAYFHTGVLRTAEGSDVKVGQLTLAGGHADIYADALSAVKHYDDTGSAIADVHAGEDGYGIWIAGALRPDVTAAQVRAFRASAPSGDWRAINGRLELVAVCQVNVPGFPVARSMVAAGAICSLVAAGAQTLARTRNSPPAILSYQERVARLEEGEKLESLAAAARARIFNVLGDDGYLTEFKAFSPERRDKLASEGKALPDGSFPIENVADLRRAVHAYGRAEEGKQTKVRRHIVKRARALAKPDLIPSDWAEAALDDVAIRAADARETLVAAALSNRVEQIRSRIK